MAEIVIIGAGLTGLSAAYHLEQNGFYDYKLFEKETMPGGLCRSIQQDGFTFDYTGHLLHINDPYFRHFIETIVGFQHFNVIKRRSFIYSQECYSRYPYQINLHGLPQETIIECIEEFINRPHTKKQYASFYSWVIHTFGKGFGKHFFFPYQEKIFSYDIKKLTASWTGRFVPNTSLRQLLQGALYDTYEEDIGYNAHFFYPYQGGIYFWINKLYKQLQNTLYTNHEVKSIDTHNKIIYFSNGKSESYTYLISTMPLDNLLKTIQEKSNTHLKQTADNLLCNSVINFNIGVSHAHLSDKHWIYFPETHYPFYRIGFPHNFSEFTVPFGCSSLYGEFSYLKNSGNIAEKLTTSLKIAKELLHIAEKDIVIEKIITIPHAYVIFNKWRDKNLPKILQMIGDMHIYSVGRYGAWKYSSMQEGLLDGKQIAEQLLTQVAHPFIAKQTIQQLNV